MFSKIRTWGQSVLDGLKEFRERTQTLVWILLIVSGLGHFAGCGFLSKCQQELDDAKAIASAKDDTLHTFKNKDGVIVAQITAAQIHASSLQSLVDSKTKESEVYKKKLNDANVQAKNVQSITAYSSNTGLVAGSITAVGHTTLTYDTNTLTKNIKKTIILRIHDSGSFYNIQGRIERDSVLTFTKLNFPDSTFIVTGTQKKWFLARPTYIVSIQHSNPYVTTTSLNNITIEPDKSIWSHPIFYMGLGAVLIEAIRIFVIHQP